MMTYNLKVGVSEYVAQVTALDLIHGDETVFRGQNCKGNLLPAIARKNRQHNTHQEEKKRLDDFRKIGAMKLPQNVPMLEIMIWAQHFGLYTRLLDWSMNPLTALWFACYFRENESGKKNDAFVYALGTDGLTSDPPQEDPFSPGRTILINPPLNNERIAAQHGCFTLHNYYKKGGAFVPLEENPTYRDAMFEFTIPYRRRWSILEELDKLGVNRRTLFPDLEGLCHHLNWKNQIFEDIPF